MKYIVISLFLIAPVYGIDKLSELLEISQNENFSCKGVYEQPVYFHQVEEAQAQETVLAFSQYLAMKSLIPYISDAAKSQTIPKDKFVEIIGEVVEKSCSSNFYLISRKNLKDLFLEKFSEEKEVKNFSELDFVQGLQVFSDICSWHGRYHKRNLLAYYMKDPVWRAWVIKNFLESTSVTSCKDGVCRLTDVETFQANYKNSVNKKSFAEELKALACMNIRDIQFGDLTKDPYTRERVKSPDQLKVSKMYLLSAVINRPAPLVLKDWNDNKSFFFNDLIAVEAQNSQKLQKDISSKTYFEESLMLRYRKDVPVYKLTDMEVNLDLVAGEFDQLVFEQDKLSRKFIFSLAVKDLKKIYDRLMGIENFTPDKQAEIKSALLAELEETVANNFSPKKNYPVYFQHLPHLEMKLAEALMERLSHFQGSRVQFLDEAKQVAIPVRVSYGLFALQRMSRLVALDKVQ